MQTLKKEVGPHVWRPGYAFALVLALPFVVIAEGIIIAELVRMVVS